MQKAHRSIVTYSNANFTGAIDLGNSTFGVTDVIVLDIIDFDLCHGVCERPNGFEITETHELFLDGWNDESRRKLSILRIECDTDFDATVVIGSTVHHGCKLVSGGDREIKDLRRHVIDLPTTIVNGAKGAGCITKIIEPNVEAGDTVDDDSLTTNVRWIIGRLLDGKWQQHSAIYK